MLDLLAYPISSWGDLTYIKPLRLLLYANICIKTLPGIIEVDVVPVTEEIAPTTAYSAKYINNFLILQGLNCYGIDVAVLCPFKM